MTLPDHQKALPVDLEGFETGIKIEVAQVTDSRNSQKASNDRNAQNEVHGGYTEHLSLVLRGSGMKSGAKIAGPFVGCGGLQRSESAPCLIIPFRLELLHAACVNRNG